MSEATEGLVQDACAMALSKRTASRAKTCNCGRGRSVVAVGRRVIGSERVDEIDDDQGVLPDRELRVDGYRGRSPVGAEEIAVLFEGPRFENEFASLSGEARQVHAKIHVAPMLGFGDGIDDLGEDGLVLALLHDADDELHGALRLAVLGNSGGDVKHAPPRDVRPENQPGGRRGGKDAQAHVVDVDHAALDIGRERLALVHHPAVHQAGRVHAEVDTRFLRAGRPGRQSQDQRRDSEAAPS